MSSQLPEEPRERVGVFGEEEDANSNSSRRVGGDGGGDSGLVCRLWRFERFDGGVESMVAQ